MAQAGFDGPRAQTWASDTYQANAGFVSAYGRDVLGWLDAKPGECILDLGCGDGALTRDIAAAGAEVVGVDASESFVATARAQGIDARVMDGQRLDFEREFDAVFTNAALHWMLDGEAVVAGVARALRPGGRFIGEFGGFGNVAAINAVMNAVGEAMGRPARADWKFFPTVERYRAMLEAEGFEVEEIVSFYRPTELPTGLRGWLRIMRAPFFEQFGEREAEAYDRVERALATALRDERGRWFADYVRLRFRARLAGG